MVHFKIIIGQMAKHLLVVRTFHIQTHTERKNRRAQDKFVFKQKYNRKVCIYNIYLLCYDIIQTTPTILLSKC